jgi:hypothetical protein
MTGTSQISFPIMHGSKVMRLFPGHNTSFECFVISHNTLPATAIWGRNAFHWWPDAQVHTIIMNVVNGQYLRRADRCLPERPSSG